MMAKGFGRLITISSTAAQTGGVIGPHYTASKAGLLGLMHSYASLLASHGITANAVAPALIETDMIRNNPNITPDLIPLKRFGQPQEVADAVLLLATNGYMNGQTINVNGGLYMS
jgi:3-oxoacyl-[acyl-carrier protein] reductase